MMFIFELIVEDKVEIFKIDVKKLLDVKYLYMFMYV